MIVTGTTKTGMRTSQMRKTVTDAAAVGSNPIGPNASQKAATADTSGVAHSPKRSATGMDSGGMALGVVVGGTSATPTTGRWARRATPRTARSAKGSRGALGARDIALGMLFRFDPP